MQIKLTECPRDAMQGLDSFIPTELKAKYINAILKVGFDVVDFGSFVSPLAIPQLKDTVDVLNLLDLSETENGKPKISIDSNATASLAPLSFATMVNNFYFVSDKSSRFKTSTVSFN
jgi:isopropylmalate/homocitrate/citramalate synthase